MLAGGGPADVVELTLALAREMLAGAGRSDVDPAERLADGSAMDSWRAMIARPGRRPRGAASHGPRVARRTRAGVGHAHPPRRDGRRPGGLAARAPGRARKEDAVQAGAGVVWHARPGDEVREGEPLFTLLTDEPDRFDRALEALEGGYDVGAASSYDAQPLVIDRIG